MAQQKIHKRGLTSFFTLFGFLIMSITGIVLYIVPAGRIAYWVNWQLMGLTKTEWGNIHILSSILFIVAGAFHIFFNWKPLMFYFKNRVAGGIKMKRELSIAAAVSMLIIISSLYPVPPLNYLLDFNEYIKGTWIVEDEYEPPFGHAELLSLNIFCKKMNIDLDKAAAELKSKGVNFDNVDESLEDIADKNGISPMDLYLMIRKFEPSTAFLDAKEYTAEMVDMEFSGTGIGNISLKSVCNKIGLNSEIAKARLTQNGIAFETDETLKKIAERYELNPLDILKIMLVRNYTL